MRRGTLEPTMSNFSIVRPGLFLGALLALATSLACSSSNDSAPGPSAAGAAGGTTNPGSGGSTSGSGGSTSGTGGSTSGSGGSTSGTGGSTSGAGGSTSGSGGSTSGSGGNTSSPDASPIDSGGDAGPAVAMLHAKGKDLVDDKGNVVVLRGYGLGSWLVPEGYMIGFPDANASGGPIRTTPPHTFHALVETKLGKADADAFFAAYVANFYTHDDIALVKKWGFNSVRASFNANDLLPEAGQPAAPPYNYNESAFAPLDNLANWARQLGIYVVLDMHAAPGSQNFKNHSDSDGVARLWTESATFWPRTVDLWTKLATRYRDNPWVIGYDLLNEPLMPGTANPDGSAIGAWNTHNNKPLHDLYVQITQAIRKTGDQKLIFAEAAFWALNFKDLTPPWDTNMVYVFHFYPPPFNAGFFNGNANVQSSFGPVMALDVPMWDGETGERTPTPQPADAGTSQWYDPNVVNFAPFMTTANAGHAIGWSWWTIKKFPPRPTMPYQCTLPPEYTALIANWTATSPADAKTALMKMAEALKTANCKYLPTMVQVIGGTP
jgi:endoglucanase